MYTELLVYYFTGTGNSLLVSEWMADAARERGIPAQVAALGAAHPEVEIRGTRQLVGVVGPTHAFTTPWPVLRFALSLPRGKGAHAFTLATRGGTQTGRGFIPGLEGTAASLTALILRLKGYRVRGAAGIDMPSNWTVVYPGPSPAGAAAVAARARPKVEGFAARLLAGETAFGSWLPLLLGILLLPVSLGYLVLGRFFLARLFYASPRCDGCGACARSCPVGAIQMKRLLGQELRPFWTFACVSCMHCHNFCPKGAVEASYPLGVLLFSLANIPIAAFLLDLLGRWAAGAAGLKGGAIDWILQYPFKLLAIAAGYRLFWLALRLPLFNRLVTLLTPPHYYARYHGVEAKPGELEK